MWLLLMSAAALVAATGALPDPGVCRGSCFHRANCVVGDVKAVYVEGNASGVVYGSGPYSDASDVGAAAVHAGYITPGETRLLHIKCTGAAPAHPLAASTAHGVTSRPLVGQPQTFAFERTAPAKPTIPPFCSDTCFVGTCVQGERSEVSVTGSTAGPVWGNEFYTEDSHVPTAAVHSGILAAGQTGSITLTCTGPRAAHVGTTANGVTTDSFDSWPHSFRITAGPLAADPLPFPDSCVGACVFNRCYGGQQFLVRVTGTLYGTVYGQNAFAYADDSSVAAAAVHAGLVAVDATRVVEVTCEGPQTAFHGTTANGITSHSWGPYRSGFSLAYNPLGGSVCEGDAKCAEEQCWFPGKILKLTLTGSAGSTAHAYGTTVYSADTPPSVAAVHMGLLHPDETDKFYIACKGSQSSFTGSTKNGITTKSFGRWHSSYTITRQ